MSESTAANNKAIVLEAFDTLFNRRDYAAAEGFWSPRYIQHSAHIAPGREGLFDLIRAAPAAQRGRAWTPQGARPPASPNTGTCCRTRRAGTLPPAACRCSARCFRPD